MERDLRTSGQRVSHDRGVGSEAGAHERACRGVRRGEAPRTAKEELNTMPKFFYFYGT